MKYLLQLATLSLTALVTGCAGGLGALPTQATAQRATAPPQTGSPEANTLATPTPVSTAPSETPTALPTASALPPVADLPRSGPVQPLLPITASEAQSQSVMLLATSPDLWDRIRRGFAMPDLEVDLVRQQEQWYTTRPDYIQRMTERSRKYLFHIVEELERRGMPSELALLPFIESAFNPQAVSSARAAGMWQFMPATGVEYELRQNVFRDDRRDVLASTRAALDYLQKLHTLFGDWHLALAAYNWGQGNVSRAIARNQRAGLPTGYTHLNMPAETRNYVPKLQAVKNVVGNPAKFGAELPLIENHPYFQSVTITRDIDVALAARLADVRLEDFKALNPSLSRPVILAAGTPQILLPWNNAKVFQQNFEGHTTGRYASWTAWTAPATLTAAEAARRVGMNEAEFRSVNNIPPRMLIRAGSTVLAPRGAKVLDDVTSKVADNGQMSLSPESSVRRTQIKAGKSDSVASIAARYKLKTADVARWNNVEVTTRFKLGQIVTLELPARPRAASKTRTPTKKRTPSPQAKAQAKTGAVR